MQPVWVRVWWCEHAGEPQVDRPASTERAWYIGDWQESTGKIGVGWADIGGGGCWVGALQKRQDTSGARWIFVSTKDTARLNSDWVRLEVGMLSGIPQPSRIGWVEVGMLSVQVEKEQSWLLLLYYKCYKWYICTRHAKLAGATSQKAFWMW